VVKRLRERKNWLCAHWTTGRYLETRHLQKYPEERPWQITRRRSSSRQATGGLRQNEVESREETKIEDKNWNDQMASSVTWVCVSDMPADIRSRSKHNRKIPATIRRAVFYREHYNHSHTRATWQWWERKLFIQSASSEVISTRRQPRVVKIEGVGVSYWRSIVLLGRAHNTKFVMELIDMLRNFTLTGGNHSLKVM
jgi:hypothetical protein